MSAWEAFAFLIIGYAATVAVEMPILLLGLTPKHTMPRKITAAFLLTAFTYPMVVLILPALFTVYNLHSRTAFLVIAETWAPAGEVVFFRFINSQRLLAAPDRDALIIVAANICSFLAGEVFLAEWILTTIRNTPIEF